jgi:hypothetical protein
MDPNTQDQNSQEMTAEDAKAALGNATYLQEQLLGQMNPQGAAEGAVESQNALGQDQLEKPYNTAPKKKTPPTNDFEDKFDSFKNEVKDMIKDELSIIREGVKKLAEDDGESET